MPSFDVSIIITAHSEGIIAHKTLLSIFQNINQMDSSITYEVIIGLDAPSQDTEDYFSRYASDSHFTILKNSFRDPSSNRNAAIKAASGKYILLLDGDDMISPNFLTKAYRLAKSSRSPVLVHPEAHLQFGVEEKNSTLWLCEDSFSKQEDALIMAYWNRWTNVQFGMREIFIAHPFLPARNGYGYEDFHFNSETRANDIEHKVAPETVVFYRKKPNSLQTTHINQRTLVAPTNLLDINYFKTIDTSSAPKQKTRSRIKAASSYAYRTASAAAQKIAPIRNLTAPTVRKMMFKKKSAQVPRWLLDEWRAINPIENQLFPTQGEVAKLEFHPLTFNQRWIQFGLLYKELVSHVTKLPDYLFLPPELGIGGTEKLMFNYVRALIELHPSWQITIIGRRPETDAFTVPKQVDFIDFDGITAGLGDYEKGILWDRLFVQLQVKRLHIVNCKRWLTWSRQHKVLLSNNNYKLYVSLFMREYTHEKGRILSLADPDLREIWPIVTKVFTDNQTVVNQALENNAFERERFSVHYQPELSTFITPKLIDPAKPLRILWASRISYQKRPDLLKAIGAELGSNATIDAYGAIEKKQFSGSYFKNSAVNYKGPFNGIDSLPTQDYDVYLYTSDTDGIPNILLEMAAKGLPIIASNVGGISEFIDQDAGILIANNVNDFVASIHMLSKNPKRAQAIVNNAQSKLSTQHSWKSFVMEIQKDIA